MQFYQKNLMNLLIDSPPKSVFLGETEWPIRWDYRYWVMFELLMMDDEVTAIEKFYRAMDLCFEEIPINVEAAKEAVLNFYQCGRSATSGVSRAANSARPYSFEYDGPYIYAAFLQEYRIDLTQVEMHWWKFRALLNCISTNTLFGKIIGWRLAEIDEKMPESEKRRLLSLKEQYAIPHSQAEQDKAVEIAHVLMESGNIQDLL